MLVLVEDNTRIIKYVYHNNPIGLEQEMQQCLNNNLFYAEPILSEERFS